MIHRRYYVPLFVLITGLIGVYVTGSPAERYLANVVLGVGLVVMAHFDDYDD